MNLIRVISLAILLTAGLWKTSISASEEQGWELQRDRAGIQVYTRKVPGSPYDAVRAVTILNGISLSSLVALLQDVPACADWADRCAEAYVLEEVNDRELYVYTHNDMPFPVSDRDVVSHALWEQDPQTLIVQMNSTAVSGRMDAVRGRLRLTEAQANWTFRPLADGNVEVSNEAHIDPGSALPGWVTNMLLVDTPFVTMEAFVEEVKKTEYQGVEISFVQEPD